MKKILAAVCATALGCTVIAPAANAANIAVDGKGVCTITYSDQEIAALENNNLADFNARVEALKVTYPASEGFLDNLAADLEAGTLTTSKTNSYKNDIANVVYPGRVLGIPTNIIGQEQVKNLIGVAIQGYNQADKFISTIPKSESMTQAQAPSRAKALENDTIIPQFLADNLGNDKLVSILKAFNTEAKEQNKELIAARTEAFKTCETAKLNSNTAIKQDGTAQGSSDMEPGTIAAIVLGVIGAIAAILGIGGVATGAIKIPGVNL